MGRCRTLRTTSAVYLRSRRRTGRRTSDHRRIAAQARPTIQRPSGQRARAAPWRFASWIWAARTGTSWCRGSTSRRATLPGDMPALGGGRSVGRRAAAISLDMLQPVVAEAAARWSAAGLTAAQAATLANVQFAVADLGGAYLGLANPATNKIRIDDDAAMFGWSVVSGQSSLDYGPMTNDKGPMTNYGVDLLTVVMHELGHLLGYEHSDDEHDLMAPVLAASPFGRPALDSPLSTLDPSVVRRPWSVASGASRADDVFADLGRKERTAADSSNAAVLALLESVDDGLLDARIARSSDGSDAGPRPAPQPDGTVRAGTGRLVRRTGSGRSGGIAHSRQQVPPAIRRGLSRCFRQLPQTRRKSCAGGKMGAGKWAPFSAFPLISADAGIFALGDCISFLKC